MGEICNGFHSLGCSLWGARVAIETVRESQTDEVLETDQTRAQAAEWVGNHTGADIPYILELAESHSDIESNLQT